MVYEQVFISLWDNFIGSLPGLIAAIITLLIGLVLGKVLGRVVKEVLIRTNVDSYTTEKHKLAFKLSDIFSLITRWWIYLVFIQQSAVFLNVAAITTFVNSLIAFIPGLVESAIIIIVGYVIASYMKDKIISAKTLYADIIGKTVFFLMVYISIALALPFVGINPTLINWILLIIIAAIGAGLAIAIGFGLKDVVAQAAKDYSKKFR